MSGYARLSCDDAYQLLLDGPVNIIDIRDEESFNAGRITDAVHVDNSGVQNFINDADTSIPLIVCCYHGNMSQSAGAYLAEKGFDTVYSLDGGFAEWSAKFPDDCEPD
ncbi:MAG: thiosulfate sulfurtransferase GlpE [Granulosicoccus sp.]